MAIANQWESWLFDGGTMPGFTFAEEPVPMPDKVYQCISCLKINNYFTLCRDCEIKQETEDMES